MHAWAGAGGGRLKDAAYGVLYALDDVAHAAARAHGNLGVIIAEAGEVLDRLLTLCTLWREVCVIRKFEASLLRAVKLGPSSNARFVFEEFLEPLHVTVAALQGLHESRGSVLLG